MATQLVPVMPVKVDPNPRGSATSHVTMPAANPFEREELSVRSANQPGGSMPGMGFFGWGDGEASDQADTSSPPEGNGFSWGGLFQNIASSAIDVGEQAATERLTRRDDRNAQADPTQAMLTAIAARRMGNLQPVRPLNAVNPNAVAYPSAGGGMGRGLTTALIISGVAAVGIVGFMMMKGGGGRRRRRR